MVRREIAPTSQALQVAFSRLFREPMLSESTSFGSRWGIYEMSSSFCASLSRVAVSAWPTNILMTSPCSDPPPQPTVPRSVAPASPAPPSFRNSLRLNPLVICCSFPRCLYLVKTLFAGSRRLQHPFRRQNARSSYARYLVELAQHYGKVAGRERQRTAVDGAPDLGQQRVAYVGHAAPDHDQGRVERAYQGSERLSHESPGLPDDLERVVISERRRLADVFRAEFAPLLQHFGESWAEPVPRATFRLRDDGRGGRHRFETSLVAARANRTVGIHADVPYVPGRSEEHTSELQSHSDLVCR